MNSPSLHLPQCSVPCGVGQRSREVVCVSNQGEVEQDEECNVNLKPGTLQNCDMGTCARSWFTSLWSQRVTKKLKCYFLLEWQRYIRREKVKTSSNLDPLVCPARAKLWIGKFKKLYDNMQLLNSCSDGVSWLFVIFLSALQNAVEAIEPEQLCAWWITWLISHWTPAKGNAHKRCRHVTPTRAKTAWSGTRDLGVR